MFSYLYWHQLARAGQKPTTCQQLSLLNSCLSLLHFILSPLRDFVNRVANISAGKWNLTLLQSFHMWLYCMMHWIVYCWILYSNWLSQDNMNTRVHLSLIYKFSHAIVSHSTIFVAISFQTLCFATWLKPSMDDYSYKLHNPGDFHIW